MRVQGRRPVRPNVPRWTVVLIAFVLGGSGCRSPIPTECEDGVAWATFDEAEDSRIAHFAGQRMEIVGMEGVGCETLAGPLAAVNWSTAPTDPDDVENLDAYNRSLTPMVLDGGAVILFGATDGQLVEQPDLPLRAGDSLEMPLYASAGAFLDMTTSEAFMGFEDLKTGIDYESYSFVFARCLVGCDARMPLPPAIGLPAVVVHVSTGDDDLALSAEGREELEAAIEEVGTALEGDARFSLRFAGVAVASGKWPEDGFPYAADGIDATLIFGLNGGSSAAELLASDVLGPVDDVTNDRVVVAFGSGAE
jgi:hypothetical protein